MLEVRLDDEGKIVSIRGMCKVKDFKGQIKKIVESTNDYR